MFIHVHVCVSPCPYVSSDLNVLDVLWSLRQLCISSLVPLHGTWICGHEQHLSHRLVCHFLVVCAVCEYVHVHLALACVLLLMHDWVSNSVSIPSVVSVSTCLSEWVHCHSPDTLCSLDRHSTPNYTPEACQVKQTLASLCSVEVYFFHFGIV